MASKNQRQDATTVTAQPTTPADAFERRRARGNDSGLSIDPEDMAARALEDATESGPSHEAEADATLTDPPQTDDALPGPAFEENKTVWEQTIDQSEDPRLVRAPKP
jgi:hypothetical protein